MLSQLQITLWLTQVEMFGLTADDGNKAAHLLQELVDIQEEICVSLGLHYRCLEVYVFFCLVTL